MDVTSWGRRGCRGIVGAIVVVLAGLVVGVPAAAQTPDLTVEYYHVDAVGSVRAVTDQSGAVVRRHDYFPFGDGPVQVSSATDPMRFTGKERDIETGLDYFGARYYASRTGRMTTVDPDHVGGNIFDPQSWNAYAYARNNPLRFIDPDGREYMVTLKNGTTLYLTNDQFDRLSDYPGAGISFEDGDVLINNGATKYGTYRYYYGFSDAIRDAGNSAAAHLNRYLTEMAVGVATGAALSGIGWGAEALAVSMESKAAQMAAAAGAKRAIAGVLKQIAQGTTKGKLFQNADGKLPMRAPGYYREYTVPLAGQVGRGGARVVKGAGGEVYYTADHYVTFIRIQ